MKSRLFASSLLFCALGLGACFAPDSGTHVNALTGEECEPDGRSYMPRAAPDHCQGTSNGDNCDDLHSGKIDCIGDGNSGQGDDKKHDCEFPQPGCDENGCCDDDMVDPPPGDDTDPDGDDGGDDGDDGDDGGDDPTPEPEPEPDPEPLPDVG